VIVRRRRPRRDERLTATHSELSYPSAHAATSVAGAVRLSETMPPAPLWALAAALAGSRLYLRVHHPSDTVAGAALGAAVAKLTR
jgi:undecaprenyl-diphosphatase